MEKILSFKTNLGWISISENKSYISSISFKKNKNQGKSKNLLNLKKQIKEYLIGKKITWKCKIKMDGTILQKKIWNELLKIPYGQQRSYGDIAKKIKTSPRYVGNVCGQNKHLIIVPCHRVVRSDGNLGGFSSFGGVKLKARLQKLEKKLNSVI